MTMHEMVAEATARCQIRLADDGPEEAEDVQLCVRRARGPHGADGSGYVDQGIRYQRCGGGYRVIRRKRGGD